LPATDKKLQERKGISVPSQKSAGQSPLPPYRLLAIYVNLLKRGKYHPNRQLFRQESCYAYEAHSRLLGGVRVGKKLTVGHDASGFTNN